MKLRDSAIAGVLAVSSPLTIWYSTQVGQCQARFLPEQETIQTIARKPSSFGLMVLLGLAQGGAAIRFGYLLLRDEEGKSDEGSAAIAKLRPSLPSSSSFPVSVPARKIPEGDPIAVGAGLTMTTAVQQPTTTMTQQVQLPIEHQASYCWIQTLLEYPSILIYGGQGSGKSTFTQFLIRLRYQRGHRIKILDPHYKAGDWKGFEIFGKGMNYREIDLEIKKILRLIKLRYSQFSEVEGIKFAPITVVCEEMVSWVDEVPSAAEFFRSTLSDIRKVGVCVVFVSHNRTLTSLGGNSGLARTRDSALIELELETKVDEATGKASPTFRGKLKLPATDNQKVEREVDLPQLGQSHTTFSEADKQRYLLSLEGFATEEGLEVEGDCLEKVAFKKTDEKSPKVSSGNGDSNSGGGVSELFEATKTTQKALYNAIANLRENGKGKTEIIRLLWGVSSGRRYQSAAAQFDALVEKFNDDN